jgi:hypothetical protein
VAITQSVFTLGTALAQILPPSADAQRVTITNLQPPTREGAYSREGLAFQMSMTFSIASTGTATFSIATPADGVQFISYQIVADNAAVTATLIEGASITAAGTPIPSFNLNRQSSNTAAAVLDTATNVTGGTVIATEFITSAHKVSGSAASDKVFTLKGSQSYAMRFVNNGNQTTNVFFDLVWAEKFNGQNDVWLGDEYNAQRLRGGEMIQLFMQPGESIAARGGVSDVRVSVIRQD